MEDKIPEPQYISGASIIRFTNHVEIPPNGTYKFEFDTTEAFKKDEQFQSIRGQIINNALFVEEKIDYIITKILFNKNFAQADLFINIILSREFFNFMNKKKVLKDLLSSVEPFKNRNHHELYQNIQKVIDERNKFAHGQVSYSGNKGEKIFIQYFKEEIVNEEITQTSVNNFLDMARKCYGELDKIMAELNLKQETNN